MGYDNSGRRARAQQTRRSVLAVAHTAFLEQGYAGTTIRGVAQAAGVSSETVYKTFRTKAALLKAVYDVTLAGDDEPIPMPQRPEMLAVRAARTGTEAVTAYAVIARKVSSQVAPLLRIVLGAHGTDPDLAAFVAQIDAERLFGATMLTRGWSEQGWLAMDADAARDVLWTLNSPSVYLLLQDRGWDDDAYQAWLARTLTTTLLAPPPGPLRRTAG